MYRRFQFEGAIHETLDCIPLTVRRKLDLAALKISLEGWQRLTRAERLALCHLPVDATDDLEAYREVLLGFAAQRDVQLRTLPDDHAGPGQWRTSRVPDQLTARLEAAGLTLTDERWNALDEESRYALVKVAEPKRDPGKLIALMAELGLTSAAIESYERVRNVCERLRARHNE